MIKLFAQLKQVLRRGSPLFLVTGLLGPLLVLSAPGPALAQETEERRAVLSCVTQMEVSTSWSQCLNLMFAPCSTDEVGSDAHLACLSAERDGWEQMMFGTRDGLSPRLSASGASELTGLMGEWIGYVTQKCAGVGAQFMNVSAEAAKTGCEISEIVGLTEELDACASGNSSAPYCILTD